VQPDRLFPGVLAEEPGGAPVGLEQTEEHPDRRGLTGSVGSEEPVHLARLDAQVEPVEGAGGAEGLDQSLGEDDGCGAHDASFWSGWSGWSGSPGGPPEGRACRSGAPPSRAAIASSV